MVPLPASSGSYGGVGSPGCPAFCDILLAHLMSDLIRSQVSERSIGTIPSENWPTDVSDPRLLVIEISGHDVAYQGCGRRRHISSEVDQLALGLCTIFGTERDTVGLSVI